MAKRSKAHHFVPKVLQKTFCFRGDEVWYSKKAPNGPFTPPELTPTEKAFMIPNYYSVLDGEELSDVVEREFYGKIDNYLGSMLPDVLCAFDRGETPTFSGDALDSLRRVVLELLKRTPEFTKKHDEVDIGKEIVEAQLNAIQDVSGQKHRREKLLKELKRPEKLKALGRSVRVQSTIGHSEKIAQELEGFSARWAVSETKHSFVLSSMIAYRIGNGGPNGLSNPNMEIWMPISPKISLVLLRDDNGNVPLKVTDSPAHIRKVNEHAIVNSMQVASQSQKLLESLTGKRSRFGTMKLSDRGKQT